MWWNLNSCYSKLRWWCFNQILSLSWLKSMRIEKFFGCSLGHNRNSKRKHIFSLDTYPVRASSTSFHFLFISIFDEKLDRTRKAEKLWWHWHRISFTNKTIQCNQSFCYCTLMQKYEFVSFSAHLNGPLIKKNIRKTWKSDIWLFFTFSFSTAAERQRKKLKLHNDFCHSLCTINSNFRQLIAAAMNAKSCRATKVHEKFSPLKKRVCKTFQSINHRLNWLIVMFHKTTATWEDRLSMNYLVEW